MADPVHNALRRKLAAAQAVGDIARINVLRGLMGEPAEAPIEVPAEAAIEAGPDEAPATVLPRRSWWTESE